MKGLRSLCLTAFVLTLGTGAASAQTTLDTPTMSVVDRGYFRITLRITAGPSGAPAGFTIDWMTKEYYDFYGGWPPSHFFPYVEYCDFTGVPTLNVDAASYVLPPNGSVSIQLGDLFDETGLFATYADGVPTDTEFAVRIHARGDVDHLKSPYSGTMFVSSIDGECTQGFWKTHPEVWPPYCTPMMLGNVSYTQAQLLQILNQPAQGNGLIFLAHQLITTRLNACNGSILTNVASTMTASDALIGNLVVPPIGSGYLAPSQASANTEVLDKYNNGLIWGALHCPTPVEESTWGAIKAFYR
jgi:hypothetical protein